MYVGSCASPRTDISPAALPFTEHGDRFGIGFCQLYIQAAGKDDVDRMLSSPGARSVSPEFKVRNIGFAKLEVNNLLGTP